jgi:hypothetical protein
MVPVGVGDEYRPDGDSPKQGGESLLVDAVGGSGIDDGDVVVPDHIGAGSREGERAAIAGDKAAHQGRDLDGLVGLGVDGAVEGDWVRGHVDQGESDGRAMQAPGRYYWKLRPLGSASETAA